MQPRFVIAKTGTCPSSYSGIRFAVFSFIFLISSPNGYFVALKGSLGHVTLFGSLAQETLNE